jgi:hypothetical protein
MAIADELVGIGAATEATLPVDRTGLATDPTGTAPGASQPGRDFLLQTLLEHLGHPINANLLHLGFNGLQNRFSLLSL